MNEDPAVDGGFAVRPRKPGIGLGSGYEQRETSQTDKERRFSIDGLLKGQRVV